MRKYANCVIQADQHAMWQAPDGSREVAPLITEETCGAQSCSAGLWWLRPGQECSPDIHPDADELYYVVSGRGKLLLGDVARTHTYPHLFPLFLRIDDS